VAKGSHAPALIPGYQQSTGSASAPAAPVTQRMVPVPALPVGSGGR
jgi:hypothetical protein